MEFSSSEKRRCILILQKIRSKVSHDVRRHPYGIGDHKVIISLIVRISLANLAYNLLICLDYIDKNYSSRKTFMCEAMMPVSLLFDRPTFIYM